MKKNILIAPNSFKEVLSSTDVALILQSEFSNLLPNEYLILTFPLSDGGDGFLEVIKEKFNTESLIFSVDYPFESEKLLQVTVEYDRISQRIFIESAKVLGLSIIDEDKRNPLELSSKGLGQLLKKIKKETENGNLKINEVIIGLGGSSVQDLGLGALSEFGLRLFHFAKYIPVEPKFFMRADRLSYSAINFEFPFNIKFVADVDNPLLGEKGSNNTFAKQKGASETDIEILEKGFVNILRLLHVKSVGNLSGAAGGIAAGFSLLIDNVEIISSEDFILNYLGLNSMGDVDFLITGEGKLDNTTLQGKAPYIVWKFFIDKVKRMFFVTGKSEIEINESNVVVLSLSEVFDSEDKAKSDVKAGLKIIAGKISKMILEN